jgi:hypothetical protein
MKKRIGMVTCWGAHVVCAFVSGFVELEIGIGSEVIELRYN